MVVTPPSPLSDPSPGHAWPPPGLRRAIVLALAALLAYAVWQAYRNPDLLLDLAAFRLC